MKIFDWNYAANVYCNSRSDLAKEMDGGPSGMRRGDFVVSQHRGNLHVILQQGDAVTIIAPAARPVDADVALVDRAREVLAGWGLSVSVRIETTRHFYLAGGDAARAARLYDALMDPLTRAIFAARGGYGCLRLFDQLRGWTVPAKKLLVGYSDITALHLAAGKLWPQVALLHGPNVATRQFLDPGPEAETTRAALHDALFDPTYEVDTPVEFLRPGQASGPLRGGCLSLLAASLGSRFALATEGAILLLEDIDEAPYRIDRLLVQLRNAGLFAEAAGIVFGVMPDCTDGINDLRGVILDVLADYAFPIAFGLAAGHGEKNLTLPLGAPATLDGAGGRFRVSRWR
ncbi:MAG: S66 peptidase family protein [Acetobacteraceae bacterium]